MIYLGLGSNQGDKEANFVDAVKLISAEAEIHSASSIYLTTPWGYCSQPDFYNTVIGLKFDGEPFELLELVKNIEHKIGRETAEIPWGPRRIDIDILLFDNRIINTPELTIPHKFLILRDFFLVPLLEIAPDEVYPIDGRNLSEYERRFPTQIRTIKAKLESKKWQDTITSLLKDRQERIKLS